MKGGIMYLIDTDDTIVKYRTYNSVNRINKTIQEWSKLVGPSFSRMYIQFAPKVKNIEYSPKRIKGVYDNKGYLSLTQEHR